MLAANRLDQRRQLGKAADVFDILAPPRGHRIVGAFHVVREQQRDRNVLAVPLGACAGSDEQAGQQYDVQKGASGEHIRTSVSVRVYVTIIFARMDFRLCVNQHSARSRLPDWF